METWQGHGAQAGTKKKGGGSTQSPLNAPSVQEDTLNGGRDGGLCSGQRSHIHALTHLDTSKLSRSMSTQQGATAQNWNLARPALGRRQWLLADLLRTTLPLTHRAPTEMPRRQSSSSTGSPSSVRSVMQQLGGVPSAFATSRELHTARPGYAARQHTKTAPKAQHIINYTTRASCDQQHDTMEKRY
jgi:hypothetical protein